MSKDVGVFYGLRKYIYGGIGMLGTLAYSRKQTDQDGGIHSQEYTNYQSFA